jgi:AraC family transcriptional regulator, arabinose operon regulatory protein
MHTYDKMLLYYAILLYLDVNSFPMKIIKLMNYLNLNQHPIQLSLQRDRTMEMEEIYHAHQGMEFLYVHEGHGHVVVERQIFELSPGSLFCFRPFQLHRVRINLELGSYVRSLFVFEPGVLEEALIPFPSLHAFFMRVWKDPSVWHKTTVDPSHMASFIAAQDLALQNCPPEHLLEEQKLSLVQLIRYLRKHFGHADDLFEVVNRTTGRSTAAEQIMEWIEEHYMEPFELSKLAQAVHLSPNHVSSLFRKAIGSSITDYITARRIRQACWLLRSTDLSVREIGENVGLGSFSYFCQIFKRNVGLSPYQYKKSTL